MSTPTPSAPTTREKRRATRRRNLILILGIPAILIVIGGGYFIDRFVYQPNQEATAVEGPPPVDASIQTVTTELRAAIPGYRRRYGRGSPTRRQGHRALHRLAHRRDKIRFFGRSKQAVRVPARGGACHPRLGRRRERDESRRATAADHSSRAGVWRERISAYSTERHADLRCRAFGSIAIIRRAIKRCRTGAKPILHLFGVLLKPWLFPGANCPGGGCLR